MKELVRAFLLDLKSTLSGIACISSYAPLRKIYAIIAILIFAALLPLPYEFYITMRTLIVLGLLYHLYTARVDKESGLSLEIASMIALVVLYNPLFVIHLGSKLLWLIINVATLFILYRVRVKSGSTSSSVADN